MVGEEVSCKCGGRLIIKDGQGICSDCGAVLREGIFIPKPVPGRWCLWVSDSDHCGLCKGTPDDSCYSCQRYLDGDTDLLLWPEPLTEAQKAFRIAQRKMGKLYDSMKPTYKKIWKLADEKNILIGEVRKEREDAKR